MKQSIHPKYYDRVVVRCACGNEIETGSTREELRTELCSACHPFYTGKQKLVDTAGRVDRYLEKVKRAQEKKVKKEKEVEIQPVNVTFEAPRLGGVPIEKATKTEKRPTKKVKAVEKRVSKPKKAKFHSGVAKKAPLKSKKVVAAKKTKKR